MNEKTMKKNGMMYEVVDGKVYAEFLRAANAYEVYAQKRGCVIARRAEIKETFPVYTSNGNFEVEETANPGEWILTRSDFEGNPVIDEYGHTNTWCMKPDVDDDGNIIKTAEEKMAKKYDMANMNSYGFVKPKGGKQIFIQIHKNIVLYVPWGENGSLIPQYVEANAFMNINNMNDIYGIATTEFCETYEIVEVITEA